MFLLAYLAFFRLSNLVPPLSKEFDITKHLCRGDFICDESSATVLVKWSKTLQSLRQWTLVRVPFLSPSPLCPIRAFQVNSSLIPASPNHSLFALPPDFPLLPRPMCENFWQKLCPIWTWIHQIIPFIVLGVLVPLLYLIMTFPFDP